MKARDVMTPQPVAVDPATTAREALALMQARGFRHLPVVSEEAGVVGVVSERDLRERPAYDEDTTVGALMGRDLFAVGPDAALSHVVDCMLEWPIGAVPVVDPDTRGLLGVISYVDLLTALRARPVGPGIGSVLVPLDLEAFSFEALQLAGAMFVGARMHVIHVLPTLPTASPGVLLGDVDDASRMEHVREALVRKIDDAQLPMPVIEVRVGAAAEQVVSYADAAAIDLIVIPSHGRRGVKRLVLGSVAEVVVRRSPCPVLVFRGRTPALWRREAGLAPAQ